MSRRHKNGKHGGGDGEPATATAAAAAPAGPTEEQVREAAYLKWEAAGRPPGDGVEFWLQAEGELQVTI